MSDATRDALDSAIRVHVADESVGQVCVAYELITASVAMESYGSGVARYLRTCAEGQPLHVADGLNRAHARILDDLWNEE